MTIYLGDTITVKIIKGTNLIAADMNGKSDPYVVLDTSMDFNAVHKTAIIEKTLNPEWNDEFVIKNLYKETDSTFLFFNVWDWDRFTSDDELGHASVVVRPETHPNGEEKIETLTLLGVKRGTLTVSIKYERSKEGQKKEKEKLELLEDMKKVNDFKCDFYVPKDYEVSSIKDNLRDKVLPSKVVCWGPFGTGESLTCTYLNLGGVAFSDTTAFFMKTIINVHREVSKRNGGELKIITSDSHLNKATYAKGSYDTVIKYQWQYQAVKDITQKCTAIVIRPKAYSSVVMIILYASAVKGVATWGEDIIEKVCKVSSIENIY